MEMDNQSENKVENECIYTQMYTNKIKYRLYTNTYLEIWNQIFDQWKYIFFVQFHAHC